MEQPDIAKLYQPNFESSPIAGAYLDGRGGVIEVNRAFSALLGYQTAELSGRPLRELAHSAEVPASSHHGIYVHREGHAVPVVITCTPVSDIAGEPRYLIQFTASASGDSDSRFRAIYDEAPAGMAEIGADFRLRSANRALARMVGHTAETLRDIDIRSLFANGEKEFRITPATESEFCLRHTSGRAVWVEMQVKPVPAAAGAQPVFLAIFQDVTARREAEDHVRRAEQRFRLLVETSPMGVIEVRRDGTVVRANDAFFSIIGWTREEFERSRQNMRTLTPEEWIAHSDIHVESTAEHRGAVMYEKEYIRRDGSRVPVSVALSRDFSTADSLLAFVVDLTAQKRAEARLRASEQTLKFAQAAAGAGLYDLDLVTGRLEWSGRNYSIFGLPAGTLATYEMWQSMIHPEDRERTVAERHRAVEFAQSMDLEYRIVRSDGGTRWLATKAGVIRDELDRPLRLVGLNFDITARKMADIALRESELRIRHVADAMPQIVWTSGPDLAVTYYNRRWYEYTGAKPAEPNPGDWAPIVHPDDMPACVGTSRVALREGQPYELECRLLGVDGAYRWHLVRSVPLRNSAGEIRQWVGTSTDIDERKRQGDALERGVLERTVDLRRSLTEKEILLREVQHRVKNNLQVVCSLIGLQIESARETGVTESGIPLLIGTQGRVQAMALIHQQLYQSANVLALDFAAYIEALAEQLFDVYGVSRRRVHLAFSVDAVRLTMAQAVPCGLILNELLSNALKHAFAGEQGEVHVIFERIASAGSLRLTVRDDGVGLPHGFDIRATKSLGMQIVTSMCTQLYGKVEASGPPGTSVTVEWLERAG